MDYGRIRDAKYTVEKCIENDTEILDILLEDACGSVTLLIERVWHLGIREMITEHMQSAEQSEKTITLEVEDDDA